MVTSAGELVALLLSNILQDFMNIMRLYVSPSDIVRRIINTSADHMSGCGTLGSTGLSSGHSSHSDSTLGEFKEVITSMVATDSQEYRLCDTMKGICAADLFELLKVKGRGLRKGRRHGPQEIARARRMEQNSDSGCSGLVDGADNDGGDVVTKPLPGVPSLPMRRQLPSRPSSTNLNAASNNTGSATASSATGAGIVSTSSGSKVSHTDVVVYSPHLLKELGRRSQLLRYRVDMQRTIESNRKASSISQYPYLATKMMVYVDPLADTSGLIRHPGTLPAEAMNTCEYSGVMND